MKMFLVILTLFTFGCAREQNKTFAEEDKYIVFNEYGAEINDPHSYNANKITVFIVPKHNIELLAGETHKNGKKSVIIEIEIKLGTAPFPSGRNFKTELIGLSENAIEYPGFSKIIITNNNTYISVGGKVFHDYQKNDFIKEINRFCNIMYSQCDDKIGQLICNEMMKIQGWNVFPN